MKPCGTPDLSRVVIGVLLAVTATACSTPKSEPNPPPPNGSSASGPPNLVIQSQHPGVAALRVAVRGPGIERELRYSLASQGPRLLQGVLIPPGAARSIQVVALDGKGVEIYRGADVRNIYATPDQSFAVVLEPLKGGDPAEVLFSSNRVEVEASPAQDGTLVYRARAFRPDGSPLALQPDDIRWGLTDPRKRDLIPFPDGSIHLPQPREPGTDTLTLCRASDVIFACVHNACSSVDLCADPFVAITAGRAHTCALTKNGRIFCWGDNTSGQLGGATPVACPHLFPNNPDFCSTTPIPITCPPGGPCTFKRVTAGLDHTCAIDANDAVWCWGANEVGQLGTGQAGPAGVGVPSKVINGNVLALAAGGSHTCAIVRLNATGPQRNLVCWGENQFGQLGVPPTPNATAPGLSSPNPSPVVVMSFPPNRIVAAGGRTTCVVTSDEHLRCWGDNSAKQAGKQRPITVSPGCTDCTHQPVDNIYAVNQLVDAVAAGDFFTCAHFKSQETDCFGSIPTGLSAQQPASRIAAGFAHMCAIVSGQPFCWGDGTFGQLGNGRGGAPVVNPYVEARPVAVSTTLQFNDIAAGTGHTCGIATDGRAFCWGLGTSGQLGDGSRFGSLVPKAVVKP